MGPQFYLCICKHSGGLLHTAHCRRYVLWMRGNKQLNKFLQKNRFIYPFIVSFLVSALTFPGGPGMFMVLYSTLNTALYRNIMSCNWNHCIHY